ncbi:hypothetical protein [Novosphingobium sp. PhB165]|uniref:hypothetical protein n=1 Tax=Novosphingobium sp. PhB165 TaxID=2485105 RepID=UPI0014050CB2|nr:hypothetical protein [Novosphingobium sp. PhB165]
MQILSSRSVALFGDIKHTVWILPFSSSVLMLQVQHLPENRKKWRNTAILGGGVYEALPHVRLVSVMNAAQAGAAQGENIVADSRVAGT